MSALWGSAPSLQDRRRSLSDREQNHNAATQVNPTRQGVAPLLSEFIFSISLFYVDSSHDCNPARELKGIKRKNTEGHRHAADVMMMVMGIICKEVSKTTPYRNTTIKSRSLTEKKS